MTSPLSERIRRATRPVMVQIAPGVYAKHPDAAAAQEITIARYVEDAPGQYRLVAMPERLFRLTQPLLDMIGMSRQRMTIMRLARAGMIEVVKVSPSTCMINLDSWFNHVRRCAEEPDLWERGGKYLREYQRAL